jgi:hypothetical protein
MAIRRAVVFRVGTVGLICAAYEVAIERGTEGREGTIRPIRDCSKPTTVMLQAKDRSLTGLCDDCADTALSKPNLGLTEVDL